ncbi:Protein Fem-1-like B [Manis pentadactyla]|nr:Protein Fem-1-like B [Manis pentadactyla]
MKMRDLAPLNHKPKIALLFRIREDPKKREHRLKFEMYHLARKSNTPDELPCNLCGFTPGLPKKHRDGKVGKSGAGEERGSQHI